MPRDPITYLLDCFFLWWHRRYILAKLRRGDWIWYATYQVRKKKGAEDYWFASKHRFYLEYQCHDCGTILTEGPCGGAAVNAVCKKCRVNHGCLDGFDCPIYESEMLAKLH